MRYYYLIHSLFLRHTASTRNTQNQYAILFNSLPGVRHHPGMIGLIYFLRSDLRTSSSLIQIKSLVLTSKHNLVLIYYMTHLLTLNPHTKSIRLTWFPLSKDGLLEMLFTRASQPHITSGTQFELWLMMCLISTVDILALWQVHRAVVRQVCGSSR